MMVELKRCPLCGGKAVEYLAGVSAGCSHKSCRMYEPMDIRDWQDRPIEDALQKNLDEYKLAYQSLETKYINGIDRMEDVADILEKIAVMSVTIILKDGTTINSGELASHALDKIRNG